MKLINLFSGGPPTTQATFLGQQTIPRNVGDPIRRGRSQRKKKKEKYRSRSRTLSVYAQQDKLARFFASNEFRDGTRSGSGNGNAAGKNSKQT